MSIRCHRLWSREDATAVHPRLPPLPLDVLLEILKRSDAATFVRAAATAKHIRRTVLDQDFLRDRLVLPSQDYCLHFDPSLLIGVSSAKYRSAPVTSRPSLGFTAGHLLLETFEPVASRVGLVVFRHRPRDDRGPAHLRVCNSLTGCTLRLPPASIDEAYPPALLDVHDAGRDFKLLVADQQLRTQVYSSKHGKWGMVRWTDVRTHASSSSQPSLSTLASYFASHPVVLGRCATVAHWLCSYKMIVALDVSAAQATVIDVPRECIDRISETQQERGDKGVLLVASPDGKLGLLVAEYFFFEN
ncbi:hypothetical protein PR202_ga13657 [Eleusine coracana subsp. coracana]|uniref:F-box domain-containing protein n=1 Tax=Eleusine coracana subsp. coracana TaxID=191504 RepID=A0AAV5CEL9_ELECO|nr:hypothetical protein PR202_ga13657 [Eleusine coracana subsp. coracana]